MSSILFGDNGTPSRVRLRYSSLEEAMLVFWVYASCALVQPPKIEPE